MTRAAKMSTALLVLTLKEVMRRCESDKIDFANLYTSNHAETKKFISVRIRLGNDPQHARLPSATEL